MSFNLKSVAAAVAEHGPVTRVVVVEVHGSAPREVGASMLVWDGGQSGTIGGGALELDAAARAKSQTDWLDRIALGPKLGQCCGGAVTLLAEVWNKARLEGIAGSTVIRRVNGPEAMPLKVRALLKQSRNMQAEIKPILMDGWMVEPITKPKRDIWIYGAGHVGRAIVKVLAPLPEIAITWVDTAADRYPETFDDGIAQLVAENPPDVVKYARKKSEHLVLTYSHVMDLEICHQILGRSFKSVGLIGSKTKWVRFQRKLSGLGHSETQISRIMCPIGRPELGKNPHAIAVGVASTLLSPAGMLDNFHLKAG